MAKKHRNRKRVSEHDALRLGMLLRHREATLSEGVPATVVEVTKGGIQVRNHTTGHVMPFPLFDAIANGKVKINDPEL